ncbi:hypothetical protein BDK51DRAFT_39770 [Blyttiomyces helicus]|uniref:Uncharacterized protein n=1 Tax=Blyttiomyces helicus TaxID=388810 RepID=A0A4P9WK18_9FUNG|nr:hypothetical protein BDK51DRAFT_39770 [Blyttiomyces helicus]|eukprot:RKO93309.1 hypothetical protein BDK51DRAFT_39770 [Blyttiomyces helicus]
MAFLHIQKQVRATAPDPPPQSGPSARHLSSPLSSPKDLRAAVEHQKFILKSHHRQQQEVLALAKRQEDEVKQLRSQHALYGFGSMPQEAEITVEGRAGVHGWVGINGVEKSDASEPREGKMRGAG